MWSRHSGKLMLPARYLFVLVIIVALYFMFRMESPPDFFPESDKFLHLFGFFILVVLAVLAIGAEFVHGTSLLPNRGFDVIDLAANILVCLMGLAVLKVLNWPIELGASCSLGS